jgi:hypothetical protein
MSWTKRYDQFATLCGLRQSSEKLERWLLRRAKRGEVSEIEIDLRVFNQEIACDRGRGYDRKTQKEALAQLDEKTQGLILITKSYTWAVHKILVRPLDFVLQEKSPDRGISPKPLTGNPMFGDDHKKASRKLLLQNISKLDSLFRKLGMHHTPDSLMRIWREAGENMLEVKGAVEYMLSCHAKKLKRNPTSEGITTPEGWLHDCLVGGWHHKVESKLPYIEGENIPSFLDSLMGGALRGKLPREKLPRVTYPPV